MFLLKSNHLILQNELTDLLNKKLIETTQDCTANYFDEISVNLNNKTIFINFIDQKSFFKIPVAFNEIFSQILLFLNAYKIFTNNFSYYPVQQLIIDNKNKIKLNFIHNKIMKELFLNKNGVDKIDMYKKIWPLDKNISLNKLDTHLTNIRNQILILLNSNVTIESSNKLLKINY